MSARGAHAARRRWVYEKHAGRVSAREQKEQGEREGNMRGGGGGGVWDQEKHGGRASARGAWEQKEQEERERAQTNHTKRTNNTIKQANKQTNLKPRKLQTTQNQIPQTETAKAKQTNKTKHINRKNKQTNKQTANK